MKLLDPKEVKTEKDKTEADRIQNASKLNSEITTLTRKLNDLRLEELEENKKKAEREAQNEASLTVKKSVLEIEVDALEKRKEVALAPVKVIQDEAERLKNEATIQLAEVEKRRESLSQKEDDFMERVESVVDRENECLTKEKSLNLREVGIKSAEDEIKRSTEKLAVEWVKFHDEVHTTNKNIENRSTELDRGLKEVEDARKVNESVRLSNEAEADRLRKEDKAIRDKYVALAQAKKHLGIKD